jgi:hypothetical protein
LRGNEHIVGACISVDRSEFERQSIQCGNALTVYHEEELSVGGRKGTHRGGPGRYTIELLKRGCHATLFDLTAENIALAKTKVAESRLTADEFLVGDARDLSALSGRRFDGILALGPLYHLTERQERIAFLESARSLLNSGGILIAAHLNAWGIARTLLTDAPEWFAESGNMDAY